jgi:2-haloacid dehalogenase
MGAGGGGRSAGEVGGPPPPADTVAGVERWATFDCYGTLIDWEAGLAGVLHRLWPDAPERELLEAYHRIEPAAQEGSARPYREVMRDSLRRLAHERGLALAAGDADALSASLPGWSPFPEVPAALEEVRRRGWRLGILSNTDPDLLDASVRRIGVPVDVLVTAADTGSYKPAPGHWTRFRQRTAARPDRHVHVAVSLFHDIAPAVLLGIAAVWINRATDVTNALDDLADLPRAAELPDLRALPETLDRLVPG